MNPLRFLMYTLFSLLLVIVASSNPPGNTAVGVPSLKSFSKLCASTPSTPYHLKTIPEMGTNNATLDPKTTRFSKKVFLVCKFNKTE